jgi:hypothetical protein
MASCCPYPQGRAGTGFPVHLGDGESYLRVVEEGKGTQQPLLEQVPEAVLNGLTDGQKKATTLVLGTRISLSGFRAMPAWGKPR